MKTQLSRAEISAIVAKFKRDPTRYLSQIPNPTIRQLLELHYIRNLEWWRVANYINYSDQNVYKLRRKALAALAELIEKEESTHGS